MAMPFLAKHGMHGHHGPAFLGGAFTGAKLQSLCEFPAHLHEIPPHPWRCRGKLADPGPAFHALLSLQRVEVQGGLSLPTRSPTCGEPMAGRSPGRTAIRQSAFIRLTLIAKDVALG